MADRLYRVVLRSKDGWQTHLITPHRASAKLTASRFGDRQARVERTKVDWKPV